ncbi:sulfatase-like hydrolase/transferase [Arthrobacter sp. AZCC_0090]|uniref:sulfatase-like hydrolase/transferase n=1 Tax=Arthrobacter sp. AZCC_0090 TaxID=2735881 RepID=UPI0017EC5CF3|nr:sulfatase-like hydrolase/transferase [Arthrobacter sp. AZCC_0090]MBB6403489.1 arylsulfatase A-like enzyme [Arthrobacter sp. AZCC_0090]
MFLPELQDFGFFDDYVPWLRRQPGQTPDAEYFDHGVNCNSVVARPWDKPEQLHPSHWIGTQAVEWMYRRDPTKPFFLYLSFHRPHPPYDPPRWAFEQYLDIPEYRPVEGNWEHHWDEFRKDGDYQAAFGELPDRTVHRARAGYYGLMAQIDLQINRIKESLVDFGLYDNTIIAFTSDHGEMMGDHHMFRKAVPYEGSARVPFIIADAASQRNSARAVVVDHVVELRDVMPTLLDLAGVDIPDSVDGVSLAPYLRDPARAWRNSSISTPTRTSASTSPASPSRISCCSFGAHAWWKPSRAARKASCGTANWCPGRLSPRCSGTCGTGSPRPLPRHCPRSPAAVRRHWAQPAGYLK